MVPVGVAKVHDHHDVLHRTGWPPSHTRLDTEQSNMTEQRGFRLGAGHAPRLRREGRRAAAGISCPTQRPQSTSAAPSGD